MKLSARFQRQILEVMIGRAIKVVEHYADIVVSTARWIRVARVWVTVIGIAVSRIAVIGIAVSRIAIIRVSPASRITVWRIAVWRIAVIGKAASSGITIWITTASGDDRRNRRNRKPRRIGPTAASARNRLILSSGNRWRRRACRVAATAQDRAEVHGLAPLLLLAHQRLGLMTRVVSDRVDNHARFFQPADVVAVCRRIAVRVNAVGENDDGFARRFDTREIAQNVFERVVKLSPLP